MRLCSYVSENRSSGSKVVILLYNKSYGRRNAQTCFETDQTSHSSLNFELFYILNILIVFQKFLMFHQIKAPRGREDQDFKLKYFKVRI